MCIPVIFVWWWLWRGGLSGREVSIAGSCHVYSFILFCWFSPNLLYVKPIQRNLRSQPWCKQTINVWEKYLHLNRTQHCRKPGHINISWNQCGILAGELFYLSCWCLQFYRLYIYFPVVYQRTICFSSFHQKLLDFNWKQGENKKWPFN